VDVFVLGGRSPEPQVLIVIACAQVAHAFRRALFPAPGFYAEELTTDSRLLQFCTHMGCGLSDNGRMPD
jgi:hypothetical protein